MKSRLNFCHLHRSLHTPACETTRELNPFSWDWLILTEFGWEGLVNVQGVRQRRRAWFNVIGTERNGLGWSRDLDMTSFICFWFYGFYGFCFGVCERNQGIARTQSPLRKNYALESPAFGVIAEVNPTEVQWKGLALDRLPSGSKFSPCQVSMLTQRLSRHVR